MTLRKSFEISCCALILAFMAVTAPAQGRGKAELKAGSGSITIDYGRPSLDGRDMVGQLRPGSSWRMGMDQATGLSTPVDLLFGSTKIAKGSYTLFLRKTSAGGFELAVNSQTGQWGTDYDPAKDVARIPLKQETATGSVETFTITLSGAQGGGTFALAWGKLKLTTPFQFAQ